MEQTFKLFAFLGMMCIASVVAEDCAPYVDSDFTFHRGQTCLFSCAGSCTYRYCAPLPGIKLDQSQFMCILNNLYVVIGAGIAMFLMIVAGFVTCICKSLCLCCSLCRPPPRAASLSTSVAVTNVIPQQQPLILMPAAAGYQPVPNPSMYAGQPDKAYLPPPYPGAANFAFVDSP